MCCSLSLVTSAQQLEDSTPEFETHEMMSAFMLEVAGSSQLLAAADSIWLVKLIDGNCVCTKLEDIEEIKNCRNELFIDFGLPEETVKLDELTEEQWHRTLLMFSLAGVMGKCPEHQY